MNTSHPYDKFFKHIIPMIPKWVTPNHLTFFRLFLIITLIFLFIKNYFATSFLIFILASLTDAIDGTLARARNQISNFGAIVDPLIDKIMIIVLIILFAKFLPWQIVYLVILTEFLMIIVSILFYKQNKKIKANVWGKLKMNSEILAILLLFANMFFIYKLLNIFIILLFCLSILFYIIASINYIKNEKRN